MEAIRALINSLIILTAYVVDLMYGPRKQAVILIPNPLLS